MKTQSSWNKPDPHRHVSPGELNSTLLGDLSWLEGCQGYHRDATGATSTASHNSLRCVSGSEYSGLVLKQVRYAAVSDTAPTISCCSRDGRQQGQL